MILSNWQEKNCDIWSACEINDKFCGKCVFVIYAFGNVAQHCGGSRNKGNRSSRLTLSIQTISFPFNRFLTCRTHAVLQCINACCSFAICICVRIQAKQTEPSNHTRIHFYSVLEVVQCARASLHCPSSPPCSPILISSFELFTQQAVDDQIHCLSDCRCRCRFAWTRRMSARTCDEICHVHREYGTTTECKQVNGMESRRFLPTRGPFNAQY